MSGPLDDSTPIFSDEEDLLRRSRGIAQPNPQPQPLPTGGETAPGTGIAKPVKSISPPLTLRGISPQTQQRTEKDQAEQARLQATGSGISQIKNPWARNGLKALDTIGSIVAPRIEPMIPGTQGHHQQLLGRQSGMIGQDIAQGKEEAQTGEAAARTDQATATAEKERADAAAAGQPKPKEESWKVVPGVVGPGGKVLQEEQNSGQVRWSTGIEGAGPLKEPTEKTPNDFEQYYKDYLIDNNLPDSSHNRIMARKEYAAAGQAPQHEPRQMIIGPDGTAMVLREGMKVPQGSKTVTGELTNKPSPDEQRRADLAENLNENLGTLEEIVARRPDLFGPVSGRITGLKGMVGSNDPDIGALETIKHQIGMAQISAHGMRSAQGVGAAAESILNSFKNGPDAVKASINAARNSVKTFSGDVKRAKSGAAASPASGFQVPAGAPAAPKEDGHKLKANGKPIAISKGGQWVALQ